MATYNPHAAISQAHLTSTGVSSSLNTAMRATSLVILLMLSLMFVSALLATRPPFETAGQSWTGITQTNPVALR